MKINIIVIWRKREVQRFRRKKLSKVHRSNQIDFWCHFFGLKQELIFWKKCCLPKRSLETLRGKTVFSPWELEKCNEFGEKHIKSFSFSSQSIISEILLYLLRYEGYRKNQVFDQMIWSYFIKKSYCGAVWAVCMWFKINFNNL